MKVPIITSVAFAFCLTLLSPQTSMADEVGPELDPVLLQMIRDDAVHEDLNLEPEQISALIEFLPQVDGEWFRARNYPTVKRLATIDQLTSNLRSSLQQILQPDQVKRLEQLECQALGTRMVLHPDIAKRFDVTEKQRAMFVGIAEQTDKAVAKVQQQAKDGKLDAKAGGRKIAELQKTEREQFVKALTPEQTELLPSMTGKTFNFSKIKRTYPMAPELESEGVTWLRGTPVQLSDLRGKVVAVHFYAFQCINCQRNLPHYQAWHADYADQGLVVIGIQTPELSSERSADLVRAAAIKEGIEYPVLLDLKSSNWNAWHNTMWPTVYLIDKKGFLRRWWQGEMNWQGNPGEKDMRGTVEALLAED
ncbi:Thiol-disulfide oxidoreductase YkuV [Rubripirellula obstinata]|uniref:Thiol-disulfide oxidoreductase YkuV n=1 Tax=Rubripirellula obstinata TaxID=406547 RepID=A0A5B1CCB6_9BACT|nr:redoxin domain-containing protein [Rubripirellula obstinata]KAA1257665.1 Thiol-disulfide oxidoreductase YkuV [Rubripirellula obstinata]